MERPTLEPREPELKVQWLTEAIERADRGAAEFELAWEKYLANQQREFERKVLGSIGAFIWRSGMEDYKAEAKALRARLREVQEQLASVNVEVTI